jgi:hypothetical protein
MKICLGDTLLRLQKVEGRTYMCVIWRGVASQARIGSDGSFASRLNLLLGPFRLSCHLSHLFIIPIIGHCGPLNCASPLASFRGCFLFSNNV